jgi:SAM-dependent methyltransferase
LIAELVERHRLRGRTVVEIGCGKGEFLSRLCTAAGCDGIGFDPSYVAGRDSVAPGVSIIPQLYAAEHPQALGDLICARHVIEHLQRPKDLLRTLRAALGHRTTPLFFETPRFEWIVEQRAFWDIFYEHCSYFAMPVLARLFEESGFTVTARRSVFGGQYQWIEALQGTPTTAGPDSNREDDLRRWAGEIQFFADAWAERQAFWRRHMRALAGRGPCAVWGAGAKGVTFLNMLGLDSETVPLVVDISQRKQGKYIPGTGQPVVGPAALVENGVASVLVMNPYYVDEIRAILGTLGLHPDVIPLDGAHRRTDR